LKRRLEKLETKQPGGRFDAKVQRLATGFGFEVETFREMIRGFEQQIDREFADDRDGGTLVGYELIMRLHNDYKLSKQHPGCEPRVMR
jgi:hypothetical protein